MSAHAYLRYAALAVWDWLVDNDWHTQSDKPETVASQAAAELANHLCRAYEIIHENPFLPYEVKKLVNTNLEEAYTRSE